MKLMSVARVVSTVLIFVASVAIAAEAEGDKPGSYPIARQTNSQEAAAVAAAVSRISPARIRIPPPIW